MLRELWDFYFAVQFSNAVQQMKLNSYFSKVKNLKSYLNNFTFEFTFQFQLQKN